MVTHWNVFIFRNLLCKVISTSESPLYPAEENKPSWRYKGAWLLCQLGSGAWLSVMPCGFSWRELGIGRQEPTFEAPPALAAYSSRRLQMCDSAESSPNVTHFIQK